MPFYFTVLSDDRFIESPLQAWVDSPWPKTAEDGYALRVRFGWTQKEGKPNVFTSDVHPIGFPWLLHQREWLDRNVSFSDH